LRQVISNLVSNAIKYTPTGGHIVVEAAMGDDHITISVTDDGFGIPLDDQPYIFDKFFRVDAPETLDIPGTGLGLSIVKSVIEKHGGRVWVESAPGEGSVFTVLLPKR
jgi:signal transduction histidine kinase